MDWSESPTTISSAGSASGEPSTTPTVGSPQSSRMSTYCAWVVSWYSSSRTWRKRRRYFSRTSGNAWKRWTVVMIRSSKSSALAAANRDWYSL